MADFLKYPSKIWYLIFICLPYFKERHSFLEPHNSYMVQVKRYFEYGEPDGTVNEIWRQVSQKLPLIKLMINRDKRNVKRGMNGPDCSCLCTNQTGVITTLWNTILLMVSPIVLSFATPTLPDITGLRLDGKKHQVTDLSSFLGSTRWTRWDEL